MQSTTAQKRYCMIVNLLYKAAVYILALNIVSESRDAFIRKGQSHLISHWSTERLCILDLVRYRRFRVPQYRQREDLLSSITLSMQRPKMMYTTMRSASISSSASDPTKSVSSTHCCSSRQGGENERKKKIASAQAWDKNPLLHRFEYGWPLLKCWNILRSWRMGLEGRTSQPRNCVVEKGVSARATRHKILRRKKCWIESEDWLKVSACLDSGV